ncbi:MAG TPA: carbon-nitrogen hydrolase family protein [Alphaproteobacteria bacterium]
MSGPMTKYRAAAVQAAPVFLDIDRTVEKAIGLIEQAAKQDVRLIAFPETWIPGYPFWIWLGAPAWGMRFVQRYFENSLVKGGRHWNVLADAARRNSMHVVAGYSERAGGSLYMGQAIFGADGQLIAARRKLKPTHAERTVFGEGDGSHLAVHDTGIGRLGALCCWEHIQPLSKYAMYAADEQVHVASWPSFSLYRGMAYALGPEVNTAASQIYAVEGGCYVLAACAVVSPEMIKMMIDTPDKEPLLKAGGGFAMIFGPDGRALAEPLPETKEGLVVADIDLGMIALAKAAADPAGHYSRPDVTRLLLDRRPAQRVVSLEAAFEPQQEGKGDVPALSVVPAESAAAQ